MRLSSSAALLVLLVGAGCGGSGDSFAQDYNRAVRPLTELGRGMGGQPREFDRLARGTSTTRQNLARLEPPDDAQDEMDALLARLEMVTADLRAVARAARSKDVAGQRRAAKQLVRSSEEVERAESALKQAVEG